METVLDRKLQSKVDEINKKHKSEVEEMSRQNSDKETKLVDEIRRRDEEISRMREIEAKMRETESSLRAQLQKQAVEGEKSMASALEDLRRQQQAEKKTALDEMSRKHATAIEKINLDLFYTQEQLKSAQFDLDQQRIAYNEATAKYEEQSKVSEATINRLEAQIQQMAASAAANPKPVEQSVFQHSLKLEDTDVESGDMEWEDDEAGEAKTGSMVAMAELGVQTSFALVDIGTQTVATEKRSIGTDV